MLCIIRANYLVSDFDSSVFVGRDALSSRRRGWVAQWVQRQSWRSGHGYLLRGHLWVGVVGDESTNNFVLNPTKPKPKI